MPLAHSAPAVTDGEPPALHDRAIDNLRFIRDTMERAGTFTAVSGWGIVAIGLLGCAAAPIAARAPSAERWLATWTVTAVLAVLVSIGATARKARRSGTSILSAQARKLVLAFAPPIIVAALLTLALQREGLVTLVPGVWMLLYGTAVAAGGAFSVRIIPVMGVAFMAVGAYALLARPAHPDLLMAASFGALHVAFGARIARRHGG